MRIDAHLHCTGRETPDDVLRTLDDTVSLRRASEHLARLVAGVGARVRGLAVMKPSRPRAAAALRRAVESGLHGAKMVPSGWYPHDDVVQPTFAEAARLKLPLLFHSGIFIDGRSGRYGGPVFFETLRDHPGVRVCLAHRAGPGPTRPSPSA